MKKQDYIDYLLGCDRHYDGYGYGPHKYALNIRVTRMGLTSKEEDKMFTIISDDWLSQDLWFMIDGVVIKPFEQKFNVDVYGAGRMGGWLELHDGPNWMTKDELEDLPLDEIKETYKIVKAFNKLKDDLRKLCKDFAQKEIKEETYTVTKKRMVFSE